MGDKEGAWFSADEQPALVDFWRVYDDCWEDTQIEALRVLSEHPTFGPIVKAIPKDQLDAQNAESRLRMQRAVEEGEWAAYEQQLIEQGVLYARVGVTFREWYDVLHLVVRLLLPRLVGAYGQQPARLTGALQAMHGLFDRAMATIGTSYIDAKEAALRESEQTLKKTEETLAATLANLHEGIILLDPQENLIFSNPAVGRILGALNPERLPRQLFLADTVTLMEKDQWPIMRALRGEQVRDVEMFIGDQPGADGLHLIVNAAPIRDRDGKNLGAVASFRDVSLHKQVEAQRAQAAELELRNRQIQEASRLKSEFLANMSHELRTPLNAIIGFTELLHDGKVGPTTPKQKEFLGDILTSSLHLLQLINDILDLSKIEAGKMEFYPEPVEIKYAVFEVCSILRATAASREVNLKTSASPEVGEVVIDAARFKQIVYNYLSNALKFTPKGGSVAVRLLPEGLEAFRIEVEDSGIGISAQDIKRLFVDFEQLDAGAAKTHGGTGLGLALTKRLSEAQGGTVGATSEPGKGSVFYAVFPRRPGAAVEVARPQPPSEPARPGAPLVLVVEDDVRDQEIIASTLRAAGYSVQLAPNGAAAVTLAEQHGYDAITLDLILPDRSGLDVLRAIRGATKNAHVPVVIITVVTENVTAGFAVTDVLPKPLDGAALVAALRRAGVAPDATEGIMVVDDDPSSLKLMADVLGHLRYQTFCYPDGEAALAALATQAPAAIILDLLMPGLDGFQFLARLRASPAHQKTPVFIWTILDLSTSERQRLCSQAQAIVQKGSGASSVVEALRAHLPARPLRGGADRDR